MTRRILGLMVTKNEADRYLPCSLKWHVPILDGLFCYDDRSMDDTREVARDAGCVVVKRPLSSVSFAEHEGGFRQLAWKAFEVVMQPTEDDWVLALDADEILLSSLDEQNALHTVCSLAENAGALAVTVPIPEVFAVTETDGLLTAPQVRLDGFWGRLEANRLFRYQKGGVFADKAMACGSAPTYVKGVYRQDLISILHFGYALEMDRQAKYDRYVNVGGHSSAHIQSIVEPPVLGRWTGPTIDVYRGRR